MYWSSQIAAVFGWFHIYFYRYRATEAHDLTGLKPVVRKAMESLNYLIYNVEKNVL